jgi:ubiquinone/menaquinone biosynthesis C-methylase UbiE
MSDAHATASDEAVPTGNTYDKYASSNPIERRLMAGFFAALDTSLPVSAPSRILEVGMGEGEVAARLRARWPDVPLTGIDLPDDELAGSWGSHGLTGSFADIAALPYPDDTFDLVLAIEVLEHVADPDAALREIRRVARPGAALVVSVPREPIWRAANMARGKYLGDLGNTPGHINHWSAREFAALVGRHATVRGVRRPFPWTMVAATLT